MHSVVDSVAKHKGQNLQIVINNTKPDKADSDEETMDQDEDMLQIEGETDILEEENNVGEDEDSIEFQVNLDKAPSTLQHTILSDKIYLNESARLEPSVPEDLVSHIACFVVGQFDVIDSIG